MESAITAKIARKVEVVAVARYAFLKKPRHTGGRKPPLAMPR